MPPADYVRDVTGLEAIAVKAPNNDLTGARRSGSFTCPVTFNPLDSRLIGDTCSWVRRLCVTCSISKTTGKTRIRVQSNGLPDHSYWIESTNPMEQNIDFEVDFDSPLINATLNMTSPRVVVSSTSDVDTTLCSGASTRDNQVPEQNNFQHMGDAPADSSNDFSGVSISGLPIRAALTKNSHPSSVTLMQDAHYPVHGLEVQIDSCLLHGTQNYEKEGVDALSYTTASPCLFGKRARRGYQHPCDTSTGCESVAAEISNSFSASLGSASNTTVIGIAKDGHLIYGPTLLVLDNKKNLGADSCNGIIFDGGKGDGVLRSYAYVATTTFPYLVGCFGPASYPSVAPTCTTNPPPLPYVPWKDLYTIPPLPIESASNPSDLLPSEITMLVDSSGESSEGKACSDLKAMLYGDGVSIIDEQVYLPYRDHDIFFPTPFEVLPTVLSVSLAVNPAGTADISNVLASYFSIGVYSVTTNKLTVRVTPVAGFVADKRMLQVHYKVQAARLGACTLRGATEHLRTGQMQHFQHLTMLVNVPVVTLTSAVSCSAGTGKYVGASATITAGAQFQDFINATLHLNTSSSHLNLPVITGNGFSDSLYVAMTGNCTLRWIVLEGGRGGRGGAARVEAGATLTIDHVIFRHNLSPSHGGGLFVQRAAVAVVSHSLFHSNEAKIVYVGMAAGGGVHNRGMLTMMDSTFDSNKAISTTSQASGGALYNVGQASGEGILLVKNEAQGNMVGEGGGVSTYRNGTLLTMSNCTFIANKATHSGGAAFVQGMIQMNSIVFENNTAVIGPTLRVTPDAPQPDMNDISVHNNVCESEYAGSDGYGEYLQPDNFRVGPW